MPNPNYIPDNSIAVGPTPPQEDYTPISLTAEDNPTPPSPEIVTSRAYKAQFAVGDLVDKNFSEIRQQIGTGGETDLRRDASANLNVQRAMQRQDAITALANRTGRPLTLDEFNGLSYPQSDPNSVIEEQYGKKYVQNVITNTNTNMPDSDLNKAVQELPNLVNRSAGIASSLTAKREYLINKRDNIEAEIQNQGWVPWLADTAKQLTQIYPEAKLRGLAPGVGAFEGGLLGSNLEEQGKAVFRLPFNNGFTSTVDSITEGLRKDNPQMALKFVNAVLGQSVSDRTLDNAFSVLGITDLTSLGKIGANALKAGLMHNAVNKGFKDIVRASTIEDMPPRAAAAAGAGDVGTAAVEKTTNDVIRAVQGTNNPAREATEAVVSGLNIMKNEIAASPGSLTQELVNRLKENIDLSKSNWVDLLSNISRLDRLNIEGATEAQLQGMRDSIRFQYKGKENSILNITGPVRSDPITNTHHFEVSFGKPNGELFSSERQATLAARFNDIIGAEVKNNGFGWYYTVQKGLDETDDFARALVINTPGSRSPFMGEKAGGVFNLPRSIANWIRTPEDTVAINQRINRKVATYAQSQVQELMDNERQYIQDLRSGKVSKDPVTGEDLSWWQRKTQYLSDTVTRKNKDRWEEFDRTLKNNQSMKDPDTGLQGYYFKNPSELEDHYQRWFNRAPSTEEHLAYQAVKRIGEFDYVHRKIRVYTNKSRVGAETHTLYTLNTDEGGALVKSDPFEGVFKKDFPGGEDSIMVMGKHIGEEQVYFNVNSINGKTLEDYREAVKQGKLKVIEIYDPETRPLSNFGKNIGETRVRYVITDRVETKPLDWNNQLPRRGGGHIEYEYEHYVKQAKIKIEQIGNSIRHWYEGDTTIMPIKNGVMGRDVADKLNTIRQMIKDGKEEEAKAFTNHNLPIEWKELSSWFKATKDAKGNLKPPRLSLDEPFVHVPKDKIILDLNKDLEHRYPDTFKNGTREGSLARQFQVKFTGERDADSLHTIKDIGSRHNPIYQWEPAQMVDPIPTLNRSVNSIINSSLMDDMKISGMEHWIKEAAPYLEGSESELKHAPFFFFNKPTWKGGTQGPSLDKKLNLLANRYKLQKFTGMPTPIDVALRAMKQTLEDWSYKALGPNSKPAIAFNWALSHMNDPTKFARKVVYHEKLGLFAWPQIIVQNMSYATIYALAPKYAVQGTFGAFFHAWAGINRNAEIMGAWGKWAEKFGWRPGEIQEAFKELHFTGFGKVAGEYINLDDVASFKITKHAGNQILDWGQYPFRAGERSVRYGAWYTAFKEYRDANPTGAITNAIRNKILDRADLLYTNMSRASASTLHSGVFSLSTQFLSYQLRLAEVFWSKRIGETVAERSLARARILGVYATLFGIPGALGVTGFPVGDYIRKSAIEGGYVVGDSWINSMLREGLPAWTMAMISGGGHPSKGNWYNFNDRYGSQGLETVRDALKSDGTIYKIFGGAAGSSIASTLGAASGFWGVVKSMISTNPDNKFPMVPQDFFDLFKQWSAFSQGERMWLAYHTGKWFSNNEAYVTDVSTLNAMFMTISGLSMQSQDDNFVKHWSKSDETSAQKKVLNDFIKEYRRGIQSAADNSFSEADRHFTRAKAIFEITGYPIERRGAALSMAAQGYESVIKRTDWDYYTRNVNEKVQPEWWDLPGKLTTQRNKSTAIDALERTQSMELNK